MDIITLLDSTVSTSIYRPYIVTYGTVQIKEHHRRNHVLNLVPSTLSSSVKPCLPNTSVNLNYFNLIYRGEAAYFKANLMLYGHVGDC